ncbi:MAG: glycoside hydrolase family 172 protein [Dehalococcoidia bacterium]
MPARIYGGLGDLAKLREATRGRASSWDRTGGNADFWLIAPGETRTIAELAGPGCVRHIWMTLASPEERYPRRSVLRMYWDGAGTPCVEVPSGDFFGVGHGMTVEYWSLPLTMSPRGGRGFNCFFPMPYQRSGRIDVTNDGAKSLVCYFYVDYETFAEPLEDVGCFHAQWRREDPTDGWGKRGEPHSNVEREEFWKRPNLDGAGNYVILEATGRGHYVGCNLNVDVFERQQNDWYGEGDDMIFVDGELTLRGTGTEDYFNTAWSPTKPFFAPYHGLPVYSGTADWGWSGKNSMYRWHIEDPVHFRESIRVTIEHGHANDLSNDYSSTAYWYQTEPHGAFPPFPPPAARLPR